MRVACFLALQILAAAGAPTPSIPQELRGASLIDSIVARVDRHPITDSQLQLEARLAFASHGELDRASGPVSGADLEAALDYLIDQMLLDDEAQRLGVFEVPEEEERGEIQKLTRRFPSPQAAESFFARFEITPDVLSNSIRRTLRANHYLSDKIRVQAQEGSDLDQTQVAARTIVNQLRARSDVRVLVHFRDAAPTPAPPAAPVSGDAGSTQAPTALGP